MATDMDMVMEETVMVKRNSLIFLTAFGLLLTGCSKSGLEITKDDILEAARDDANATKSECENVLIKEQKSSYIVSFTTNGGSYEYKIGKDGIIQDRNYKRSETEEETQPVEEQEQEPVEKEKKKKKFDENQQKAIDAALVNAGLGSDDVTDMDCVLDENTNQYTVTFNFQNVHNTAIVDGSNFVVLSSIQG